MPSLSASTLRSWIFFVSYMPMAVLNEMFVAAPRRRPLPRLVGPLSPAVASCSPHQYEPDFSRRFPASMPRLLPVDGTEFQLLRISVKGRTFCVFDIVLLLLFMLWLVLSGVHMASRRWRRRINAAGRVYPGSEAHLAAMARQTWLGMSAAQQAAWDKAQLSGARALEEGGASFSAVEDGRVIVVSSAADRQVGLVPSPQGRENGR
ncbi:hypothetical protein NEH83_36765 [Streptomyces sp. JUS-F4]|uniref:hypothetical protein n=1 Tax=Streptomyces TaxID=1883 RepID=UPI001F3DB873|nr:MULTISPECIES: hypothetical protein [Streptomyces]WKN12772.1 hypothetical protein NEH83_00295 [Streptomyces sp. JUS-F4]WKN19255.1 hypothetical protein NEH83_36765 [Streptomyces sp. JUS-F4]